MIDLSNPFIDLWGTNSCATPDHTTIPCPPSPWVYLGVSPALSSGGVSTYTITFTAPSAITKIHYGATCSFGGTTGVYRVQNVSLY